jgi:hypothetical protein
MAKCWRQLSASSLPQCDHNNGPSSFLGRNRDSGDRPSNSSSSRPECDGGGGDDINADTFRTMFGAELRVDCVWVSVAEQCEVFLACDRCGHLHWKEWRWDEAAGKNEADFAFSLNPTRYLKAKV